MSFAGFFQTMFCPSGGSGGVYENSPPPGSCLEKCPPTFVYQNLLKPCSAASAAGTLGAGVSSKPCSAARQWCREREFIQTFVVHRDITQTVVYGTFSKPCSATLTAEMSCTGISPNLVRPPRRQRFHARDIAPIAEMDRVREFLQPFFRGRGNAQHLRVR